MQELRIMIENTEAVDPGMVKLTLDYDVAYKLYEAVKREMENRTADYRYAKMSADKGAIRGHLLDSFRKDVEEFEPIYRGVVSAYLTREEV